MIDVSVSSFPTGVKLSIDTSKEQMKPVARGKRKTKNRVESIQKHFSDLLDNQNFDAKIKTKHFSVGSSSTGLKLIMKILMREVKPVVTEKKALTW